LRELEELDLLPFAQKVNAEGTNLRRLKRLALILIVCLFKERFSDKNYTKKLKSQQLNMVYQRAFMQE